MRSCAHTLAECLAPAGWQPFGRLSPKSTGRAAAAAAAAYLRRLIDYSSRRIFSRSFGSNLG